MSVPYIKVMKHATKVVKNVNKSRPILQGVLHDVDGSLSVTDSHRLYRVENAYETSTRIVKNPKTGENIDGNYPDVTRLIPNDGEMFSIPIDVKLALGALKAMKLVIKTNKHVVADFVRLTIEDGIFTLSTGTEKTPLIMECKLGSVQVSNAEDVETAVNGDYLLEALDFINDIGYAEATFRFYGNNKPFILSESKITALILPVRVGNQ